MKKLLALFVDIVVNELGDVLYDDVLEPAIGCCKDTRKDVSDWWDTLWW